MVTGRPRKKRIISKKPESFKFSPRGRRGKPDSVVLTLEEFEAVRLADYQSRKHTEAAASMNISRQTFGNIIVSAHKKIADTLVNSKALRIEGGVVKMMERHFVCHDCKNEWSLPYGGGRPHDCPKCKSLNIHRAPQDRGWARGGWGGGHGFGRGRGRCGRAVQ